MEYTPTLRNFGPAPTADEVSALLEKIGPQARRNCRTEVYKRCFGCIDLTSLGATDSRRSIGEFTRKAIELPRHFPEAGSVASICVYPVFVETVGLAAGDSKMAITSVSGGFPSSQTYLEVKMLETAMAIENGADEIDIVISIGEMLDGEYDLAGNEIETLRAEIGDDAILKVILESGTLSDPELIHKAATIAMEAGADFIKTSTGKNGIAATPEAAVAMCLAIRQFAEKTGRKVGFKAAGGISTAESAALYYSIVEEILGEEWLTPELFRIGASSLANNLLSEIEGREIKYF
ncbi:deoxyribose-phosphate aldolase [Alistipes indistinctus]|jgi:deoxyribose-phosphate aldolase|uniref:deoxyribose-phosphate aldolase n=1 Tax=Alistipes indistinctus TaxID=626932 RepID=UPI00267047B6|nr:deoxyribose-phosphate aldolase [Alistipes indistinctus]